MSDDAMYLALGGVMGAVHAIKALAVRGLISPEEVDAAWDAIISQLQDRPGLENVLTSVLDDEIAEIRSKAAEWNGWRDSRPSHP